MANRDKQKKETKKPKKGTVVKVSPHEARMNSGNERKVTQTSKQRNVPNEN